MSNYSESSDSELMAERLSSKEGGKFKGAEGRGIKAGEGSVESKNSEMVSPESSESSSGQSCKKCPLHPQRKQVLSALPNNSSRSL